MSISVEIKLNAVINRVVFQCIVKHREKLGIVSPRGLCLGGDLVISLQKPGVHHPPCLLHCNHECES